ncbi:MAG: carboxypeptidase-like regulatory domain-containing protein [Acidobacteriia bacterium]|nr:carboxypeptidase-like regulatory domain-containing protein [Terriglobia bacterium]
MNHSLPFPKKILFGSVILILIVSVLAAQGSKKAKPSKLALGVVVDQDDQPIPTAIVNLTNLQSKKISQDITDEKGEFRFGGLSPDINYELQALFHDHWGKKETISIYDTRLKREFYFKLPVKLAEASQEVTIGFVVMDEHGRGIPGASLKITGTQKIEKLTATTDSNGRSQLWLSTVEHYSIVVEAKGYETQVRESFTPTKEIAALQIPLKAAK